MPLGGRSLSSDLGVCFFGRGMTGAVLHRVGTLSLKITVSGRLTLWLKSLITQGGYRQGLALFRT